MGSYYAGYVDWPLHFLMNLTFTLASFGQFYAKPAERQKIEEPINACVFWLYIVCFAGWVLMRSVLYCVTSSERAVQKQALAAFFIKMRDERDKARARTQGGNKGMNT